MSRLLRSLNPDAHKRPLRALMLGLYVAGASALVAVIVQGSVGDAATFGFVLGGIWGITRGPLTKIHAESDAPENDTNAQEEPEDKPKLTLLPRP